MALKINSFLAHANEGYGPAIVLIRLREPVIPVLCIVRFSDFHMQSCVQNVNKHIHLENIQGNIENTKGNHKWKIYH